MKIAAALVIISLAAIFDRCVDAYLPCSPCIGGNCVEDDPKNCIHGIYEDLCGRKYCAKGPGQLCGSIMKEKEGIWGICGDGMFCHCNRCSGCSLATFECFSPKCV